MKFPIMSPDDGGADGGTTGAATGSQGGSTSNDEGGNGQPQFMTVDEFNRGMSNYKKRMEKSLQDQLSAFQSTLAETLQGLQQGNPTTKTEGSDSGKSVEQPNKDVLKLQKQIEELTSRLEQSDKEKTDAIQKATEGKLKSEVLKHLSELKVEKGEQVYRLIRDNISVDDNGKITMKVLDPRLGFEDEKDVKAGLTDWLNNDGKHFLPPVHVNGSGASNSGTSVATNKPFNVEEFLNMKPSEAVQVDLSKALGADVLNSFMPKK